MNVDGTWTGDERVVNGVGRVTPGKVSLPVNLAAEFERQGLFKPSPRKAKEMNDVRADD